MKCREHNHWHTFFFFFIPSGFLADVFVDIQETNLFVSTKVMENTLTLRFISSDISKTLHKVCLAVRWKHSYCVKTGHFSVLWNPNGFSSLFQSQLDLPLTKNQIAHYFMKGEPIVVPRQTTNETSKCSFYVF